MIATAGCAGAQTDHAPEVPNAATTRLLHEGQPTAAAANTQPVVTPAPPRADVAEDPEQAAKASPARTLIKIHTG